jgi:D-alanyl-D-alanine carboxypeptidase
MMWQLWRSRRERTLTQALDDRIRRWPMRRNPGIPPQLYIVSGSEQWQYVAPGADVNQPFHMASIGKLFTALLIMRLVERGRMRLDQAVCELLDATTLQRLFVYDGVDYAAQVTVAQLLGHTSGVADYFEGRARGAPSVMRQMVSDPEHIWTPSELLAFTRTHQRAQAAPGSTFHYSDTGYILLGLMIENDMGMPLEECLHHELFAPLGMHRSYLMHRGLPIEMPAPAIAPVWLAGHEVSQFRSVSSDWAGGGIVSTPADAVRFMRALHSGTLLQPASLQHMMHAVHRFQPGLWYGLGMMEVRFEEFFFLLRGLPRLYGHIGVVATHLWYEPLSETTIVLNVGDSTQMVASFRLLIDVMNLLRTHARMT